MRERVHGGGGECERERRGESERESAWGGGGGERESAWRGGGGRVCEREKGGE